MGFIAAIISWFNDLSGFFYDLYLEAFNSIYIPDAFADILYTISDVMAGIAWQFYYFSQWIDDVVTQLGQILNWDNIRSYILAWLPDLQGVVDWFGSWLSSVYDAIEDWFSSFVPTLQSWINSAVSYALSAFNEVIAWIGQFRTVWDSFSVKLPTIYEIITWFSEWPARILAWLESLGYQTIQAIQFFVAGIILQFFPFYNDLVSIWNSILEFFADPLQWVYNRLDEFFERFW